MSAPAEHSFDTLTSAQAPVVNAPDGSRVQVLPGLKGGSMASFLKALGLKPLP